MSKFFTFLGRCVLDNLLGYIKEMLLVISAVNIPELLTSKTYVKFKGVYDDILLGYKQDRKNPYTEKLQEKIRKRKLSFKALSLAVKSFLYSDIAAEKQAATLLNRLLLQYSDEFSRKTISGSTSLLVRFIALLDEPECKAAIATLKLDTKVAQLLKDEGEYESVYLQSVDQDSNSDNVEASSNLRKKLEESLQELLKFVDIMAAEQDDPKWKELSSKLAILNSKFEQSEAVRQTALKKKREDKQSSK